MIFLLHIAQASYKKTICFFESVKRLCRRNLSVIVLVFLKMWVCFWKKKCAHLILTVSPLACWVLNCLQFIISQVFFLALVRSVHANNLSHLGLTDTVHINAGLYGCWWNLGFLHVWVFSAPSNSTVCYKILLRSFSLFPALFCMLAVWWKLYRIHKILKLYFTYGHVYAYFCIKSELGNIVLLEAHGLL